MINGFSELMAQVFGDDAGVGAQRASAWARCRADIPGGGECIFEVQ